MPSHFLYSTNVFLKLFIQEKYRNDVHYVWCSEVFDSSTQGTYTVGGLVVPSSNPADIYRELQRDVTQGDLHSAKLAAQKAGFLSRAAQWEASGEITKEEHEDIVYHVNNSVSKWWRPLIYVIPRTLVAGRLQPVPASKRAGLGNEYIISDLQRSEFDIIEL